MNKVRLFIWDTVFELNVSFQNYPGEEITDLQIQTLEKLEGVDFSQSLPYVHQYIQDDLMFQGLENTDGNMFDIIIPESVVILRDNDKRVFLIMCEYKYDEEHGISIVYENEKFTAVGTQSLVL